MRSLSLNNIHMNKGHPKIVDHSYLREGRILLRIVHMKQSFAFFTQLV